MIVYVMPENVVLEPVVREGKGKFCAVFLSSIVTEQVQNFRCTACGWVVAQYNNKEVDALVYGASVPKNKKAVDVMCSRCKFIYRIV